MERQSIYINNDEIGIASLCSSPGPQLPNNVPDTYSALTRIIAAQHGQLTASRNLALQYPPTPPNSLISDDNDDEIITPRIGNPTQPVPYTPNRRLQHLQLCQRKAHIRDTPESSTLENSGKPDLIRHYDLLDNLTTSADLFPSFSTVIEGLQDMKLQFHIKTNAHVPRCLVLGKI